MSGGVYGALPQAPVQLAQVDGRDSFGPRGGALGRLSNVTLLLEPGLEAFVGRPEDGTAALCEILAGRRRPKGGAVAISGRDPACSPAVRRRLGVLLPVADLPPGGTVAQVVSWAERVRGVVLEAPLEAIGIATLGARRVDSLTPQEARAVELAVALALPEPLALVLYEPLSAVGPVDVAATRRLLAAHVERGCCVVLATSAPRDVEALVEVERGRVHLLERGRLTAGATGLRWPPPQQGELSVWVDAGAEELHAFVAALGQDEELVGVGWRAEPGEPASVTVRGRDVAAVARAVAQATRQARVKVLAVDHKPLARADLSQLAATQRLEAARALAPVISPLADAQEPQGAQPHTGGATRVEPGPADLRAGPATEPGRDP